MLKLNKSQMNAIHVQIKELIRNGVNVSIIMNIITFACTCAHKILYTHIHNHSNFYSLTPTMPQ
jgi:hypothetical protein